VVEPHHASPLLERLVPLAQEAFDARHYNAAYHLLSTALHEGEGNVQHYVTVQRLAEEFLGWIDRFDPAEVEARRRRPGGVRTDRSPHEILMAAAYKSGCMVSSTLVTTFWDCAMLDARG
jgi:hypothetical protein